jgi:autotransporter-associated beta strand protein
VFNCAVSGDEIDFCNTSRCCDFRGGITVAKPVFINSPEDSNARAIVGNWIITNDWSPVPYNELGKNDGIGSSITVQGELLNPNNIIIYSGSVVTAATMKVTTSTYPAYLNNGRLVISGMIDISNTEADFKLARVDSDNATIIAGGIVYNTSSWAVLNAKALVLGADGISFNSTLNNNLNFTGTPTLYASGAATTLHAGKDDKQAYTIGNGKTLTVCTTRFDSTEPSTITIDGKVLGYYRRSYTGGMAVTGNGTLVFNSASTFTGALAVRDTATVKVNAACTPGTGEITLGAGTTLSLIATGSVFSPIANIVNIPTGEGEIATINLDGRRLMCGEQVICTLGELPEGCNVADHVTVTGTALRGRKCTVKVGEGNNLVVDIISDGMRVIIR